ncbi:hypothetical protein DL93DRAFT_2170300 [Clavulina sp. PMI_390]|nr:hypothetical protein DL93DRAFT_2170300 [Clavulina sp. PMI_390]
MFWRSKPTVEDIQAHIDELHARVTELEHALERAPQMNYLDAIGIGQAAYRLGAYLKTCTTDTRNVPDPVDHEQMEVVLQQVRDITPAVISICDRTAKAKKHLERLSVTRIVRIQLLWVASHQRAFADALLKRFPKDLVPEGEQYAQKQIAAFDELLRVFDVSLQRSSLSANDAKEAIPLAASGNNSGPAAFSMFWRAPPTIEVIQAHINEMHARVIELDQAIERAPHMNLVDAAWVGRATYRLGAYIGTSTADTRHVPDPIDHAKAEEILQQVREMTPAVISVCARTATAKKDFEKLYVTKLVKFQLKWVAGHQRAFAEALLKRAPADLKPEGEQISNRLIEIFDDLLKLYGIPSLGALPTTGETVPPASAEPPAETSS